MNSRERCQILLARQIPDRMGMHEKFWQETLRDYWPAQGYPAGTPQDIVFDHDMVRCGGQVDTAPFFGRQEVIEESEEARLVRDGYGATLRFWKKKSGTPEHVNFEVATPEIWTRYREPLLETDPRRLGDLDAQRAALAEGRARGKFTLFANLYVFELLRCTLGDQLFLPSLLMQPDWVHDFCQVYLDFYRRHYELLFREVGLPDGFWINEDFGFKNGLFCSPATLREMILPYHKALVDFFKSYGLPVILHSCGDIRKAVPVIIDMGYDCLQPMEAKAGCHVLEIAREHGSRLAYMGNINVMALTTNDPAQVEAEILPKLRGVREARIPYFFHSDHSIPPNVNLATYQRAMEVFWSNCEY